MSLRARIALLIGIVVLVSAAVAGLGTALTTTNLARSRIDDQLRRDAASLPTFDRRDLPALANAFDLRRLSCNDTSTQPLDEAGVALVAERGRRNRLPPSVTTIQQLITADGSLRIGCTPISASDDELAIARKGQGGIYRTETIDGTRYRIYTTGVGDLGAVQLVRELDTVEDALSGLMGRIVGFGLLSAAAASAMGWFLASRAVEPVYELSAAAERVAQTRDLGERIAVDRTDELGNLAASFNTMMTSLDASRSQQHRLVQDASHELRTPLTSIRTNVDLLRRHPDIDADTRRTVLDDIESELTELTDLTAELVDSATEVAPTIGEATETDLAVVASGCVERAARRWRRDIKLTTENPGVVLGDATMLTRAIDNLINNAVKFSEPPLAIEVRLHEGRVEVADRGPGVPQQDLPHIFDRFFRATTARSAPGSGLGLSIVRQIAEAHDGSVHARNATGGGAVIGFEVPVID